jgi:hypothetical protein
MPHTPDPSTNLEQTESTRREFLKHSGTVLAGIALSSLIPVAAQTQTRTQANPDSKGVIDLGPISTFKNQGVTDRTKDTNAHITHTTNGLIALVAICTHEGLRLEQPRFRLPLPRGRFCNRRHTHSPSSTNTTGPVCTLRQRFTPNDGHQKLHPALERANHRFLKGLRASTIPRVARSIPTERSSSTFCETCESRA